MAEYIERQSVLAKKFNLESRLHEPISIVLASEIERIPAADVVSRNCYDKILWENDIMRRQLAEIGKAFGEKMDNVRPVVRGRWDADGRCSACRNRWNEYLHDDANDWGYFDPMPPFCLNCGADMREGEFDIGT